jgi:uncharacterized protein (DUF362 family)
MKKKAETDKDSVDRREFLKRLTINSAIAAGAVAAGFTFRSGGLGIFDERAGSGAEGGGEVLPLFPRAGLPASPPPGHLAVARGGDPVTITRQAVEALGGMQKFVARGDRVLLKPNIGWDRRPKFAANTNPDVVAAVARMCLEAGASKVVVTDSPCNNPARCFDKSGLKKKLAGLEVELLIPTDRDYVEKNLGGEVLGVWPVLRSALDSDKIINIPIAKHHSSAVLSMGMKNWFGILGGGTRRGQLHQEMSLAIAELASAVRPALTVLDAYRILFRNGPQGGSLRDTKKIETVVASADPVAVDAYGARFFDLEPGQVPYVSIGEKMGLGSADPGTLETILVGGQAAG